MILGSGPNRIGQGIEFDYCCVHAAMTVRASGRDAVMINCNPETVSTDYDTSDRLYFEPLTLEDVLAVIELEQPEGVIVQFGGQTPLRLAAGLERAGVRLLGTSVDAIDVAEDRGRFGALLARLGYQAPPYATARTVEEALEAAAGVGFPLLVRPSYVLGGRAMEIVYDAADLERYLQRHAPAADGREIFLDRFLENAIEVDVDALCDGARGLDRRHHAARRGGRHPLRRLGLRAAAALARRGDARADPRADARDRARARRRRPAQRPVRGRRVSELYVIEANPRASRTVPFVSKAIGLPLAKLACRIMLGEPIAALGLPAEPMSGRYVAVKEAVLPFNRFYGADSLLGPEMRSTGEVMGIADATSRPRSRRRRPRPARRCRPAAPSSSRSPTPTRRPAPGSRRSCTTSASRSSRRAARRRRSRAWASRCARCARSARARRTSSTRSPPARSTS